LEYPDVGGPTQVRYGALRDDGYQVGALEQERGEQEALHGELDAARDPGPLKVLVDDRDGLAAAHRVDEVPEPQVSVQRQLAAHGVVARPDTAQPAVGEQPQAVQLRGGHDLRGLDDHVGRAVAEQADRVGRARQDPYGDARRRRGQAADERADEHQQAVVGAAHGP